MGFMGLVMLDLVLVIVAVEEVMITVEFVFFDGPCMC